jgi:hypothetical protein
MQFQPIDFGSESPVKYSFSMRTESNKYEPYSRVVAAHFAGEYRDGSGGKPDAGVIVGITAAASIVWDADAIILDLRELDYRWGDEMDLVCSPPEGNPNLVFAIVGSERCLPAISTLFYGVGTERSATEVEHVFDDFNEAAEWVETKLSEKRETLNRQFPKL